MPRAKRFLIAGAYVGGWLAFFLSGANNSTSDGIFVPAWIVVSVGVGFVIGRWRAVVLAASVLFVELGSCDAARFECGEDLTALLAVTVLPITAVLIAAGVVARKVFDRRSRSSAG